MEMHSAGSLRDVHGIDARPAGDRNSGFVASIVKAVRSLAAGIAERRRLAREFDELQRMDDRMLADIGITRGEIDHVIQHGRQR